ncbi:DUF3298 domain-containing protein [Fusibacter sp. JL216-2]|uniref:DUF3298 domain-containing protein n=1 Tax=Fusibacter sp. JL216-2 TaxID=3071453 RepID=UPI003D340FFF
MKAKILAVFAAGLLLTACQTADINEKTPQDEVQIENNETSSENVGNEEENTDGEAETETTVETENEGSSGEGQDEQSDVDKTESDSTSSDELSRPEDEMDQVEKTEGQDSENEVLLGYIPNEDIKTGVVEACQVLYDLKNQLNGEGLETIEFDNIYDKYWVQKSPVGTMESLRSHLKAYFTDEVIQDLIDMWGLIEYDGRLLAPEISKVNTYDPESLEPIVSEVDEAAKQRFINLGFVDESGVNQRTLLVLNRFEKDKWKINTMPGTGKIKQYGRAIIRNKVWIEGDVEWHWPDFMASEDQVWDRILEPVQSEIREQTTAVLNTFEADEAFKKIGASQLSYWTSWKYSEDNIDYPHMDIILSEYMKYGIHPNHVKETVTLSKNTNEPLDLSDLYKDKEGFYETVNVYIDKHMRENPQGFYTDAVFEGINGASQFYITEKGVTFYFQLYEYAPYAFGYPEIEVPFQVLDGTLSEPFQKYLTQTEENMGEPVDESEDEPRIENTDS